MFMNYFDSGRKWRHNVTSVSDAIFAFQVGLDQQTVTVVCTNRRRKFLLDTADASLTQ